MPPLSLLSRDRRVAARSVLALTLLTFARVLHAQAPPGVVPLSVDDALTLRRPAMRSTPALSPDEALVAIEVTERARAMDRTIGDGIRTAWFPATELLLVDRATATQRRLVEDSAAHWGPVWSPDGRTLAFLSDAGGLVRIWLWDRATAQARPLTDRPLARGAGSAWPLEWTPDGGAIIVRLVSDGVVMVGPHALLREPGTESTWVTVERFAGSRDPNHGSTETTFRQGVRDDARVDLALVHAADGRIETLLARTAIYERTWLSPAGQAIAFVVIDTLARGPYMMRDLYLFDLGTRRVRRLARPALGLAPVSGRSESPSYHTVSWSPDGRLIAFRHDSLQPGDFYVADAANGVMRLVTPDRHPRLRTPVGLGAQWGPRGDALHVLGADTLWVIDVATGARRALASRPGWELLRIVGPGETATVWSPDTGRSVFVVARERDSQRMGVLRVNTASGESRPVFEGDLRLDAGSGWAVGRSGVVYAQESAVEPPAFWTADVRFERRRPLAVLDSGWKRYVFGRPTIVRWLSLHGEEVTGVLLRPAGYVPGRRYPLIVSAYPDDQQAQGLNVFGTGGLGSRVVNLQLLATRGYAVLLASAPLRPGEKRFDLAATVLPGVNRVVEMGVADPDRLGVIGQSDGGNTVLALLTQTPRFRAGVVMDGYADDVTAATAAMGGDIERPAGRWALWERTFGYGGSPWERPLIWHDNSPLPYFDRIVAPVLVIHGSADASAPLFAADQIYAALRRLGKPVTYAKYQGQGHVMNDWSLGTARDATARILEWLELHVGRATQTEAASGERARAAHNGTSTRGP